MKKKIIALTMHFLLLAYLTKISTQNLSLYNTFKKITTTNSLHLLHAFFLIHIIFICISLIIRPEEISLLNDNAFLFLTDVLLIVTIFSEDLNIKNLIVFFFLLGLKALNWILTERIKNERQVMLLSVLLFLSFVFSLVFFYGLKTPSLGIFFCYEFGGVFLSSFRNFIYCALIYGIGNFGGLFNALVFLGKKIKHKINLRSILQRINTGNVTQQRTFTDNNEEEGLENDRIQKDNFTNKMQDEVDFENTNEFENEDDSENKHDNNNDIKNDDDNKKITKDDNENKTKDENKNEQIKENTTPETEEDANDTITNSIFILDIIYISTKLISILLFFFYTAINFRLPFNLFRESLSLIRALYKKIKNYVSYRRICRELNLCENVYEKLNCPICFCEMDVGKKINCGHVFHMECLKRWSESSEVCPMCRRGIFKEEVRIVDGDNVVTGVPIVYRE